MLASAALVAVLASACSDAEPEPSFRGIGFLPDLPDGATRVFGISRDGRVVVGAAVGESGYVAFRWTSETGIESLGVPPGRDNSEALAANVDGSVIAGGVTGFMGTAPRAARWSEAEGWLVLEDDGFAPIQARAVSADGATFVGTLQYPGAGGREAFLWTQSGGFAPLGELDGVSTAGSGISADADVVSGFSESDDGDTVAFRWTEQSGMVALAALEDGEDCIAQNVSADGRTIVGQCGPDTDPEAVLWDERGVVDLGTLPGGIGSLLWAVSGDGSIGVGEAGDSSGVARAVLWTASAGVQDLRDVLVELGLEAELEGWFLSSAVAISSDGRTVAGTGIDPQGRTQGFVATRP
jgi:probable HAF family extracellular repeat protein